MKRTLSLRGRLTLHDRIGHAALEVFLMLKGYELEALVDEQERIILAVAAGDMSREEFSAWVERHVVQMTTDRET